ncbi:hypothetical protein [Aeromicrobium sp. 179-A 4D2 NHS]|uniref:hypothetical protein n=1 Tax=Aeromicrobium sp. 179-A 4D2 NHS TaxID=3142375 RepID=UPI0039A1AB0C
MTPHGEDDSLVPFTLEDVLHVLEGRQELSADGSVVTVRDGVFGRTYEVHVEGAVAYLCTFLSTNPDRVKARSDAISYFDLEVQEYNAGTNPVGDPIIIDADGPRLTHEVPSPAEEFLARMGGRPHEIVAHDPRTGLRQADDPSQDDP